MAANLLPSYLGNVTAQRDRLSAIRQRLSLEPSEGAMRGIQPSGSPPAPADKPGAAIKAGQAPINFDIPQDAQARHLDRIQKFIDANHNGVDDRQEGQQTQGTPPVAGNSSVSAALNPLSQFFRSNGRAPNVDELHHFIASKQLEQSLGRAPSDTEVMLYRSRPPKG